MIGATHFRSISQDFRPITPTLPTLEPLEPSLKRIASLPLLGLSNELENLRPRSASSLFSPRSKNESDKNINNPSHMPYFSFKDLRDHYFTLDPNSSMAKKIVPIIKYHLCYETSIETKLGVTLENILKSKLDFITLFNKDSKTLSALFDDIFDDAKKISMIDPLYQPSCFFVVENKLLNDFSIIKIADLCLLEKDNINDLSLEHFEVYNLVWADKKIKFTSSFLSPDLLKHLVFPPHLKKIMDKTKLTMTIPIANAVSLFLGHPGISKIFGWSVKGGRLEKLNLSIKGVVTQSIANPYNFLPLPIRTRKNISRLLDSPKFKHLFANLYQLLIADPYIQARIETTTIDSLIESTSNAKDIDVINTLFRSLENFFSDPPAEFKDGVNLVKKVLDDTVKSIIGMTTSSKILRKSYLLYMNLGVSFISMASTYAFGYHNEFTNENESVAYLRFLTAYCIIQFIQLRASLKYPITEQETLLLKALAVECVATIKCAGEIAVTLSYLETFLQNVRTSTKVAFIKA